MLLEKTDRFWKNGLIGTSKPSRKLYMFLLLILFGITGCSNAPPTETQTVTNSDVVILEQSNNENVDAIAEIYCQIYENVLETNELGSLEMLRCIVEQLGNAGYVAVDSGNQIDMTGADQVLLFCDQVDAKERAELTIIAVSYSGGYTKYELKTEEGSVEVTQKYFAYQNGQFVNKSAGSYLAEVWQYTDEGYLLFGGSWYLDTLYVLTLSDVEEHVALRVQPLDEKCRELNRQYIHPVGYSMNNMFITDWSEDDFGELDFYDLFDVFYQIMNNQYIPFAADDNLGIGAVYRIPKADFETSIMPYFNIDSDTLQSKVTYFSEDETYQYKPRGFYEIEYPDIPYSEVVNYMENNNGTITLTVNAVYPHGSTSKLFAHEVVVRLFGDGSFQYVSNQVITPADEYSLWWHSDRLTDEQWEDIYGGE